jgi:hypothetical protein
VLLADSVRLFVGSAVDTAATVAVAIGTLGAVAYALFRDLVVMPRRRPRLQLQFGRNGNDQIVVGTAEGSEAARVRLRVTNQKGRDTADDVVVVVTELRRLDSDTTEVRPIGLPLGWSGTMPPLTVAPVHPGSGRHVDLLHVDWPGRDELEIAERWIGRVPLELDVTPKPVGRQELLDAGAYELSVEVRARNADSISYVALVSWDGKWSGKAAMWDHLRVESPRVVSS